MLSLLFFALIFWNIFHSWFQGQINRVFVFVIIIRFDETADKNFILWLDI